MPVFCFDVYVHGACVYVCMAHVCVYVCTVHVCLCTCARFMCLYVRMAHVCTYVCVCVCFTTRVMQCGISISHRSITWCPRCTNFFTIRSKPGDVDASVGTGCSSLNGLTRFISCFVNLLFFAGFKAYILFLFKYCSFSFCCTYYGLVFGVKSLCIYSFVADEGSGSQPAISSSKSCHLTLS